MSKLTVEFDTTDVKTPRDLSSLLSQLSERLLIPWPVWPDADINEFCGMPNYIELGNSIASWKVEKR